MSLAAASPETRTSRADEAARVIHPPLARRRSTRAFSSEPIDEALLSLLFEAARWAPSAMNRQGWRFVVGRRGHGGPDSTHELLSAALAPGNQVWADRAPVLVVALAPTHVEDATTPDLTAAYELGLAVANLETQAHALGLVTHQMGGFSREAVRTAFAVPAGWTPVVVLAVGRPGDVSQLPDGLARREVAPRERTPLQELVFAQRWQAPALPAVDGDRAVA
jgi:nitroreductase